MDIKDYRFEVGDEVITTDGLKGKITGICKCSSCRGRGFYEPTWIDEFGDYHYITNYDAESGFSDYHNIGNYRFNNFDINTILNLIKTYENDLSQLKVQLKTIGEIENGR